MINTFSHDLGCVHEISVHAYIGIFLRLCHASFNYNHASFNYNTITYLHRVFFLLEKSGKTMTKIPCSEKSVNF